MPTGELARLALAWLGTYLLHSTLFLGLAWLLFRAVPRRAPGLVDRVWKLAVVGGVVTASVQLGLGSRPILGQLSLPSSDDLAVASDVGAPESEDAADVPDAPLAAAPRPLLREPVESRAGRPAAESGRVGIVGSTERGKDRPAPAARGSSGREPERRTDRLRSPRPSDPRPSAPSARTHALDGDPAPRTPLSLGNQGTPAASEAAEGPRARKLRSEREPAASPGASLGRPLERPGGTFPPAAAPTATPPQRAGGELRLPTLPWRGAWRSVLFAGWGILGGVGLCGILVAWSRISRRLSGRREIVAGDLHRRFQELVRRSGIRSPVRLTATPALECPITRGFLRREVCVPLRILTDLSPLQQDSLLAHELAHAKRRDPLWFFVVALLERLFFFQPLNRLARRRLHEVAELLCDDDAVRWTGQKLALASCLTEIAGWVLGRRALALATPSIAGSSRLGERVERLLDDGHAPEPEPARRWWRPTAGGALVAFVFAVPGVSSTPAVPAATAPGLPPPPAAMLRAIQLQGEVIGVDLDRLEEELPALRAELERTGHLDAYAGALTAIDHRVKKLRELDQRRQALLDRLRSRPAHPTSPESSLEP